MSDHHVICRHCGVGINVRCDDADPAAPSNPSAAPNGSTESEAILTAEIFAERIREGAVHYRYPAALLLAHDAALRAALAASRRECEEVRAVIVEFLSARAESIAKDTFDARHRSAVAWTALRDLVPARPSGREKKGGE